MNSFEVQSAGNTQQRRTPLHARPEASKNESSNPATKNASTLTQRASSVPRSRGFPGSINSERQILDDDKPFAYVKDVDVNESSLSQAKETLLAASYLPNPLVTPPFNSIEYEKASASTLNAPR